MSSLTINNESGTNQPTATTPEADQLDAVIQKAITHLGGMYQILPGLLTAPVEGSRTIGFSRTIAEKPSVSIYGGPLRAEARTHNPAPRSAQRERGASVGT